jgi:dipeptidyl aminopeptidase/acylaminoacyl peptidase
MKLPFCFALIAAVAASSAEAQKAPRKLTLDMYLDWEEVQDPQISPDGKQIVFARRHVDKVNDRWKSALWVMNADGAKQRFLAEGSQPRWSPDGTRIAYVADGEPKGGQIFVRYMDAEGSVTQITRVDRPPAGVRWSPDSRTLAFVMLVPKKDTWDIKLPARPDGAKWTENPRIVERVVYRRDRIGFLEDGYRHIFTVPASGGTARQLTDGNYDHGGGFGDPNIDWTPDGKEIVFSGLRAPDAEYAWRESEIYAVRVADATVRQITNRKGPDQSPAVSPDGRSIAYTGYDWTEDTYTTSKLYLASIDGSSPRLLTPGFDRSPVNVTWAPDGSGVYFTADDRGARNLHFAPLSGPLRQVTRGTHLLSVSDINANGQAVGTLTSFQKPADVVTFSLRKPEIQTLTAVNEDVLHGVELGDLEELWYPSLDDLKIQGWLVKPPDFDPKKKYPLILSIHGGPHSMYGVGFSFAWQHHAAEGYLVLYTNPRGSTGYGSAFGNAINNSYPGKDYDDLMKGVDLAIAKGSVDERNLFVYGCSGGGVLTAWIVGHTDRFAAASSNCPVVDWLSFVGTTDGATWYRNFKKLPWEDPSEHLRRSPLMYVGNVTTPTMLMTGVNDLRTPISQTEEFYQALKMRKVPTAMVRFNDEYHGTTSKPSNFLRTQLYLHRWFTKHARKDEVPAAGSQPLGGGARR